MQPNEPTPSDLAAENAHLHQQLAALTGQGPEIGVESAGKMQSMRNSEALLAESQRLARIGSFELDVTTLTLTWTDQQFRNFGFEPAPSIDRALVVTRIHPDDLAHHEAVVKRGIETGEPFSMDYRVVHPDGTILTLHTIGQPVCDALGRVVKIVGTSQDVTERRQLEEQLRAQYEQLKQLDALKSNFVNSVTHELRTPLASIVGFAEFLEDESAGPLMPRQRDYIGEILYGANRLERLVNDLLDFARIEAGTFRLRRTWAEMGDVLQRAIDSLRPQAEAASLSLVAIKPEALLRLDIDAQRIGQVFTNLIANAIRFSPKGSEIRVSTSRRGEWIRCEVQDTGPGIAVADQSRLFRRFSQLSDGIRSGKGTGLGLSICKALVEAHGGTIGVESAPGAGSTFWFELPVPASGS
ncbi:MAG TPA: ATP-binding protein [Oscillatoriaceae cyanobacterium]